MTTVTVVGSGPAAEAVRAAIGDTDAAVTDGADDLSAADLAVVVADVDDATLERCNREAVAADLPWLAVEVGGVGGQPVVPVSVAGFAPGAGCHACLRTRVGAALEDDPAAADPSPGDPRLAGAIAGREAVGHLQGGGDGIGGRLVEVPDVRRSFLPVPGCEVCGTDREGELDRSTGEADLDTAVGRTERAVDPRVGIVTEVGERESFPAPYYLAAITDTTGFSDVEAPRHAAGVAVDWNSAYMKALGEAIERYSAGTYRVSTLPSGTPGDVADAVPPDEFVRPDDATGGEHRWVPGEHLATGETVRLPAGVIYHPPPEPRPRPVITTGLGVGSSGAGALAAGLSEVVERDATMLAWYSTYEPLGLAVDRAEYDTLVRRARSEGLSATALLLTQDVDVPVVGAVVHRGEWPRFAAGSAADLDAGRAATAALAEALQNWMELRAMGPEGTDDAGGAIGRYADFPREVRDLVGVDPAVPAADVGPADPPPRGESLEELVGRVDDAGLDAYAARLTTRDVETLGFEAVRVVVPGAQPLFVDEPYFGERARTVPRELGFRPRLDRPFHPYP